MDGVAMGSPLSPAIANFYMESFEASALETAALKPVCWYRYVDDTFVIWSHGQEKLRDFLLHLNSIHPQIQFTMEIESDGQLPFLDVLVRRKDDGTLGHSVYRKPTHTDRYLHKRSNHHPCQKRAVLKTLLCRATRICEPENFSVEIKHLENSLQANGYSLSEIRRSFQPRRMSGVIAEEEKSVGVAFLPYIHKVTDRIGRLLQSHGVKPVFKPTAKVQNLLRTAKDPKDALAVAGVYRIPCSCGAVYIGTTKRSIKTRLAEHERNCRLGHTDKSAVADHAYSDPGHNIEFSNTDVLSTTKNYFLRLCREAIEIFKHENNFNRKEEVF